MSLCCTRPLVHDGAQLFRERRHACAFWNFLLVTIDTVRYDHTTMGGYKDLPSKSTSALHDGELSEARAVVRPERREQSHADPARHHARHTSDPASKCPLVTTVAPSLHRDENK